MRKLFSLIAVSGALLTVVPAQAQDVTPKFAFINSQAIIAQAPGAREAQQAFEKDMAGFQTELQKLETDLKTLMSEYEQKQVMLSPDAKQQKQEEIQQKQIAYQQRAVELERKAAERQAELVEPIMQRINEVIGEIRKNGNYAIIFDVAEGGIVAADPALDLTAQVLERLNAASTTAAKQP